LSGSDVFAIDSRPTLRCVAQGGARFACALQWLALVAVATCVRIPVAAGASGPGATAPAAASSEVPPVFGPAFLFPPLDTLRVTGGFGEVRAGHFHAGFDFSTSHHTGEPVRAPIPGTVERVRASGVGYGRSIYLRGDDGRLVVFGHLDAYTPALAAYVDSAQRAEGFYERDLWPPRGRFRFFAGETLAWSGQSGAGPPHLHVEIRHDDFAIHPLRGGLVPGPVGTPRLVWLALEPLDASSRVEGGLAPRRFRLRAAPETLEVEGRLRAVVRSRSGVPGGDDAPAWSTRLEWNGETVEARLDSISWAGEMSQIGLLVDRGRIANTGGMLLWAPAGFRPRFLRTSAPEGEEAGVIHVARGDPPRPLVIVASEPGGERAARVVMLRPPPGAGPPPLRARPAGSGGRGTGPPEWTFEVLPDRHLRVRVTGAPAGLTDVRVALGESGGERATWDGHGWLAIVGTDGLGAPAEPRLLARGRDGTAWSSASGWTLWHAAGDPPIVPAPGARVEVDAGDLFQPELLLTRTRPAAGRASQGLVAAGQCIDVEPGDLPLRRSVTVKLEASRRAHTRGLGLYQRRGSGSWGLAGESFDDATRLVSASSSGLGEFAVMRDTLAPHVRTYAPMRGPSRPYSEWRLEARVIERGSGVDASRSGFWIDGARVPTEWDPEARRLRWRPLEPPPAGTHRYEVRAVDRAGNATTRRGTFVLGSGRR